MEWYVIFRRFLWLWWVLTWCTIVAKSHWVIGRIARECLAHLWIGRSCSKHWPQEVRLVMMMIIVISIVILLFIAIFIIAMIIIIITKHHARSLTAASKGYTLDMYMLLLSIIVLWKIILHQWKIIRHALLFRTNLVVLPNFSQLMLGGLALFLPRMLAGKSTRFGFFHLLRLRTISRRKRSPLNGGVVSKGESPPKNPQTFRFRTYTNLPSKGWRSLLIY